MNLQYLCLETIAREFERYNFAFSSCKDENVKRIEFLQRTFSQEIFSMPSFSCKDEYLDLLLNKYVKVLNTQDLSECSWEKVSQKIRDIGSNLEEIYISTSGKPWHEVFCYFPNLKVAEFATNCDNTYLKCISEYCPNIEKLYIVNSKVSNKGLWYLYNGEKDKPSCPHLKMLYLDGTFVSEGAVRLLIKNIHSIEDIDFVSVPNILYCLHKNDLNTLDKVKPYNITRLNLLPFSYLSWFANIIKICISVCPHLVSFTSPLLTPEHLNLCLGLSNLQVLQLKYHGNTPLDIDNFLKVKGIMLISLKLDNFQISIFELAENCCQLQSLRLKAISFKPFNEKLSISFPKLESFSVEYIKFINYVDTNSVCKVLEISPKLKAVHLQRCNLIPKEVHAQVLKCCEQLSITQVCFNFSTVEEKLVRDILVICQTLIILNLTGCSFERSFLNDLNVIAKSVSNKPIVIFTYREEMRNLRSFPGEFLEGMYNDEDLNNGDFDDDDSDDSMLLDDCDDWDDINFEDSVDMV